MVAVVRGGDDDGGDRGHTTTNDGDGYDVDKSSAL